VKRSPAPASSSPPIDSPYRDQAEAAAYLRLKPTTLEKYRIDGTGPRYRKHGDRVVYSIADLNRWSDARARVSTSDAVTEAGATTPH
jgi:hypothetical protein